ncbi:hypothetical protein PF010_g25188 [Phytophthora fragariae]|uniref:Uncharacterized protein n=1 Tax=Phytophthora fragariae TaxID=53985 RepID=A0A6G0K0D7_9STRA|nr:hypothetical protein PF010_g25188 [Phytophthora fragariae]KAE9181356.1 hypothetical protein PF004_g24564 [Phytophthora fragariae]
MQLRLPTGYEPKITRAAADEDPVETTCDVDKESTPRIEQDKAPKAQESGSCVTSEMLEGNGGMVDWLAKGSSSRLLDRRKRAQLCGSVKGVCGDSDGLARSGWVMGDAASGGASDAASRGASDAASGGAGDAQGEGDDGRVQDAQGGARAVSPRKHTLDDGGKVLRWGARTDTKLMSSRGSVGSGVATWSCDSRVVYRNTD